MIDRFEIIDHDSPRPDAELILFCDGTGGKLFRADTDLELIICGVGWFLNR